MKNRLVVAIAVLAVLAVGNVAFAAPEKKAEHAAKTAAHAPEGTSVVVNCNNGKNFKLSLGSAKGACTTATNQSQIVVGGACKDAQGHVLSQADCETGCKAASTGDASCAPVA